MDCLDLDPNYKLWSWLVNVFWRCWQFLNNFFLSSNRNQNQKFIDFFFGLPPQKRTFIEIERTFYITNKIKIHRKTFFFSWEGVHWKYFVCCLTYNETNEIPILMMIKCVQWSMGEQSSKPLIRSVRLHCNRLNSKFHKYPRFVSLLNMQLEFLVVNLHMTAVQGPSLQKKVENRNWNVKVNWIRRNKRGTSSPK